MIAFANPYKHPRMKTAEHIAQLLAKQPIEAVHNLPEASDMAGVDDEVGKQTIGSFLLNFHNQPDALPAGSAGAELLHYLEHLANRPDIATILPERFSKGFSELSECADDMNSLRTAPWQADGALLRIALHNAIQTLTRYWQAHQDGVDTTQIRLPDSVRIATEKVRDPAQLYPLAETLAERADFEKYCPFPDRYAELLENTRLGAKALEPIYREIMRAAEAVADKLGIELPAQGRTAG